MSARIGKLVFLITVFLLAAPQLTWAGPITFFYTDFDGGAPPEISGVTATTGVQGFVADGFSGNMLHNESGGNPLDRYDHGIPGLATVLTLVGLPEHTFVDINFLLAVIDSWDGVLQTGCGKGGDFFNVVVDGVSVISDTFGVACGQGNYAGPAAAQIGTVGHRGFADLYPDRAYDMGLDPRLFFAHTAATLTVQFFANGPGWQGGIDESWGIDNLEIILIVPEVEGTITSVPEPGTLLLVGGALLAGARRLRSGRRRGAKGSA